MHGSGKSDSPVVPAKPPNKAVRAVAEAVEGRGLAKGNTASTTRPGRSAGPGASSGLERVREVARRDKEARFTALLHHVDLSRLRRAYCGDQPEGRSGSGRGDMEAYGQDLEANLQDLHARVHGAPTGRARLAGPTSRRPTGGYGRSVSPSLEDKIVQRAVVEVLNAIYEVDFLGFSYGFRPGRSPHDALDALAVGIDRKKVNWVLDADIRDFFNQLDHAWLRKFLEHRIADKRVLRLIDKWLNAGVIEDGKWTASDMGAPQGASASPLLANVYLHYVLDRWVRQWRRRHAHGDVIIVRFADDFVAGFENQGDAQAVPRRASSEVREVRPGAASRQDAAHRVRAVRRPEREAARPRQAGDVRLPRLHAHLREDEGRTLLAQAQDDHEADAGQACARSRTSSSAAGISRYRSRGNGWRSVVRGHLAYYAVPGNTEAVSEPSVTR